MTYAEELIRLQLINDIRGHLPLCRVSAWDEGIRISYSRPDPLFPLNREQTFSWYVTNRAEYEQKRPEIVERVTA